MKKPNLSVLCTAALFALTACTPAADATPAESTAETEATAEAAETVELTAEADGALHTFLNRYGYTPDAYYQCAPDYDGSIETGTIIGTSVYRSDFAAGETTLFFHTDEEFVRYPFLAGDTLYFVNSESILARPMNGGSTRDISFDGNSWHEMLYSDRALYCMSANNAPFSRTTGMRLDLLTGETSDWKIPEGTMSVLDVVGDTVLLSRFVSDYPLPLPDDAEMSDAIMQNSQYEYDLIDASTGEIVRKVLSFSYYGDQDEDGHHSYYYLGKNGADMYFRRENADAATGQLYFTVLCVHSDGTREDLGLTLSGYIDPLYQGEDLHWLMLLNSNSTGFTIYDLQGNKLGETNTDTSYYQPMRLLDDGRVLLAIGYTDDSSRIIFATIDADAFLSGSTDYTEMMFVE